MAVIRNYLVISPLSVVVEDAGIALSYSPGQIFAAPDHLPSIVSLLADEKIVESLGASTNGFNVVIGPPGPTGPQGLGGTLASTLLQGNTTGGSDIILSDGDDIVMGDGTGPSNLLWNGSGNIGSPTMAQRPDTIYAETSVVVGNTVTITTDTITGSTSLALNANTIATLDALTAVWIGSFSPAPIQVGLGNEYPQAIYEGDPNGLITIQPGNTTVAGTWVWLSGAWAGTADAGDVYVEGGYGNALYDAGAVYINGGDANGGPLAGVMEARGGNGGATAAGGQAALIGGGSTHASLNAGDVVFRGGTGGAPARDGRTLIGDQSTRDIRIGDAVSATQTINMLTAGTIDIRSGGVLGLGIGSTNYFTISAAGAITAASAAAQDLVLGARGANTNFNQAGQVSLHASYTGASRNSIIGALNAIADGAVAPGAAQSLSAVLLVGNTTGASNISINAGQRLLGAAELTLEATGANPVALRTNSVERLRVDANGQLVIGTSIAAAVATPAYNSVVLLSAWSNTEANVQLFSHTATPSALTSYNAYRARGTVGAPTTIVNGDGVAQWLGWAYVGAAIFGGYGVTGRVTTYSDGVPSTTSSPGRISLESTPVGALLPIERLRVNSAGEISLRSDINGLLRVGSAVQDMALGAMIAVGSNTLEPRVQMLGASAVATQAPILQMVRSRGTIASPVNPSSGDAIGLIAFSGTGAQTGHTYIQAQADGAWSAGNTPTRLSFWTSIPTTGSVEHVRINSNGTTIMGANAVAQATVHPMVNPAHQLVLGKNSGASLAITSAGGAPVYSLYHANGTLASPTVSAAGNALGFLYWNGFTSGGSEHQNAAYIAALAATTYGGTGTATAHLTFGTANAGGPNVVVERLRISNVKTVAVGDGTIASFGASAIRPFQVYSNASTVDENTFMQFNASATSAPALLLMHARGTAAAPTVTLNGDTLGYMYFCGAASSSDISLGALISSTATATHGPSSFGGDLRFSTSANGASALTERVRIGNAGHVTIAHTVPAASVGIQRLFVGDDSGIVPVKYQSSHASGAAGHYLQRSRGSLSAQTAVVDGDTLGFMSFLGYVGGGGDGMIGAGSISCQVDGTPTLAYVPGRLTFSTNPVGGVLTERWRINNAGHLLTGPADNTYDIGATGATRPRRVYVGTEVVVGNTITVSTDSIIGSGSLEVASGASQDLTLRARGTGTVLNQSGQLGLHTSYTAASRGSLVGALNSLVDGAVGRPPEVYTTNEGEVALLEEALPAAVLGEAERSYYVENSNGIELTAAPGEFIRLGSVIGLGIRGVVAGTILVLRPINGTWIVKTITGAWTMIGEDAFAGATALWQLDDGLVDSSGNGHHLTYGGGTAAYNTGKVGNAVAVGNGSGYLVNTANGIPSMQSSDFTIMGWVNFPSFPGDNMSLFNRGTGGFNDLRCYVHSDGRVDFWANSSIMQTAAGKITAGNWHHVVVRRIGSSWELRVDNVVSASHSGSITINTTGQLHFGVLGSALGSGQAPPANTLFDQWALYMTGIDNADIDAIYNVGNGVSSNETPIAGADAV